MASRTLRLGVVGGLGTMASPMAMHWRLDAPVQVMRVHDRGAQSERHDTARRAWRNHGSTLVPTLEALVGDGDLDGVMVCCGKNGDDSALIGSLARLIGEERFICHLSTVSARFADAAHDYCANQNVHYVNYPLTGGPLGAQQATMLILASGDTALFHHLQPALSRLGTPRYFGVSPIAGAEVKLIGQLMVFNSLLGLCSAVAVHAECFNNGIIGGEAQAGFFDFLNTGAGGSRQWDVAVGSGIKHDLWDTGFSLRYAVVDALYAADLCMERGVSYCTAEAIVNVALGFSYVINRVGEGLASHSLLRELIASKSAEFDQFILKHSGPRGNMRQCVSNCLKSLPESIQTSAALDMKLSDFEVN